MQGTDSPSKEGVTLPTVPEGPCSKSELTELVSKLVGVKHMKSTSFHPQTDGQTERMNRVLEEMLRHYVNPARTDWDKYLTAAEFAVNNSWHESTK